MNESERVDLEKTSVTSQEISPTGEEVMETMCHGIWRLKPDIVLRIEDDGAILFDPNTDSLSVINSIGGALLNWRRNRICFDEWCDALYNHYNQKTDQTQIQTDIKKFLGQISHFTESYNGKSS